MEIQRFSRPSLRDFLFWTAMVSAGGALIPLLDDKFSMPESILFGVTFGIGTALLATAIGMQRIMIDGLIISTLSIETLYRRHTVHAKEVTAIRLHHPGQSSQYVLVLSLAPKPGRKWTAINAKKTESLRSGNAIDCPAFLALVTAVRHVKPSMTVSNLPPDYNGPLRLHPYSQDNPA